MIPTPSMPIRVDSITGLIDRRLCMDRAARRLSNTEENGQRLGVLWINLDRFQQVNRSFGHDGGDQIIQRIAQRLRATADDAVDWGHMGGDEFVCLVATNDVKYLQNLAKKIKATIDTPLKWADMTLHPSASIGIALHQPGEDVQSLMQRADQAMLAAKQMGGNRCVTSNEQSQFSPIDTTWAREELEVESRLHLAMEQGGLQLHYQPIIGEDGRVEAVEALMRCQVDGKFLLPARFIPVAEKTGRITRLGEWTLMEGALFARKLQDSGFPIKVAVNVSRAQLLAPQFSQAVHGALICAGITPARLELELTESLFMDMSQTVQDNLRSAGEAGVGLAIDDFGTGYSCLANLRDIHATKLKLDRAFVTVLPQDARAFAIVKAMTRLGQELGMTIVAEGVETQAQADALRHAHVNAIQGYLHSPAMPGETLIEWLSARQNTTMHTDNNAAR